ncbi:MAG: helix-turn-helix transcriptional regulator [Alistipes senegalensis]|nr:helix-turn-helix transcriptional regulator [Bacteroides cellulosilyticus]MCM1351358.1 helix-turn-helix transcriptional regulator [Alistipes senegalensis]
MTKRNYSGFCPVRNILARIGDKWSMLVLCAVHENDGIRFGDLYRSIPDISQKMLTSTLRTLESEGYLSRKVYPEAPPRVEYSLTPLGRTLIPHIDALVGWALSHRAEIEAARQSAPAQESPIKAISFRK